MRTSGRRVGVFFGEAGGGGEGGWRGGWCGGAEGGRTHCEVEDEEWRWRRKRKKRKKRSRGRRMFSSTSFPFLPLRRRRGVRCAQISVPLFQKFDKKYRSLNLIARLRRRGMCLFVRCRSRSRSRSTHPLNYFLSSVFSMPRIQS